MRYLFDEFVLDVDRRELRRDAQLVSVEPQVFDLLVHLVSNRDRVVSKTELLDVVWKRRAVSESTLFNRINAARTAVGDGGEQQRLIRTLPRKGMRFIGAVQENNGRDLQTPDTYQGVAPQSLAHNPLGRFERSTIAVLPFDNLNRESVDDYFCDGISGEIITALSRFPHLAVISRNSSFTYKGKSTDVRIIGKELGCLHVLEGSILRSGERVRISCQLVDTATGTHRWADKFDKKLDDIFVLQDELAGMIGAIIAVQLTKAESERSLTKPPATWQSYDFYLRGSEVYLSYFSTYVPDTLYLARRHLEKCLSLDSENSRALETLARTYMSAWVNPLDEDHRNLTAINRAHELAVASVRFDAHLPQAHAALGYVLTYKRQHDDALAEYERAFELNPSFTDWSYALALVYAGEPKKAIETVRALTRLDPFLPPVALGFQGFAHYMLEQYHDAVTPLRECVRRAPNFRGGHFWLAATYAMLGRNEEAQLEAAEVMRIEPGYTISGSAMPLAAFKHAAHANHWLQGLHSAGFPQ